MQTVRLRVYLFDEAPRIGCGWRTVTAYLGRKYVRLMDDQGNRAKISCQAWREIARYGRPAAERKRRRRRPTTQWSIQ